MLQGAYQQHLSSGMGRHVGRSVSRHVRVSTSASCPPYVSLSSWWPCPTPRRWQLLRSQTLTAWNQWRPHRAPRQEHRLEHRLEVSLTQEQGQEQGPKD